MIMHKQTDARTAKNRRYKTSKKY